MPSGIRGRANPDYSNTEYAQPWAGIDVSLPSSQIQPSACVSLNGAIVRGGLTNSPSFAPIVSSVSTTIPSISNVMYTTNLGGATYFVTEQSIYTDNADFLGASNKNFRHIFDFPTPYNSTQGYFCSCVIGSHLYLSNSQQLGVYQIAGDTVQEITALNGSGPFIGASFMCTIANRLVLGNIIGGDGNQQTGTVTPSTTTHYPDRVAWSFPSAFGSFDPNGAIIQGGFDQLTEARGLITGLAVFEAVAFVAHNGGFTEMVPNTSGGNIEPFTFAPLWSADQGVVCRYGSMAQYGSMCCFLGFDQPYQLSPGGLTPVGDQISSLVQNLAYYQGVVDPWAQYGVFGSIVEVEGEKHYLITFTTFDFNGTSNPSLNFTYIYDMNMKTNSWTTYFYPGLWVSGPIYQSFDNQNLVSGGTQILVRDNWILVPTQPSASSGITLSQMFIGNSLFNHTGGVTYLGSLDALFRAETPTINIPQTTRKVMVEYENIPAHSASPTTLSLEIYGQPLKGGYPSTGSTPITNVFTMTLPYYASGANVPQNAVLTAFSEPIGTANTTLATSLEISTTGVVRIIRVSIVAETTQADQK